MEARGIIRGYGRTVNFATGETSVGWRDDRGVFIRKLFVSRPDNVVGCSIKGLGPGKLSCRIGLATRPANAPSGIDTEYWNPKQKFSEGIKDIAVETSGTQLTYRSSFPFSLSFIPPSLVLLLETIA